MTNIVSVQDRGAATAAMEFLLHRMGQGGLATTRQAGEPENGAGVAVLFFPVLAINGGLVPEGIGGFIHRAIITAWLLPQESRGYREYYGLFISIRRYGRLFRRNDCSAGGFSPFVDPFNIAVDQLGLLFKQTVAGQVAVDDEWTEVFHFKHPHGLGITQLLQPVHRLHALDAAPQQCAPVPYPTVVRYTASAGRNRSR